MNMIFSLFNFLNRYAKSNIKFLGVILNLRAGVCREFDNIKFSPFIWCFSYINVSELL